MKTISEFVKVNIIRLTAERTDRNPHMDGSDKMDNWKTILHIGRKRMTVYFSKGYGHNGKELNIDEVLDCIASDSASYDNALSFEDWAGDFGYDTDSRKALRTYKVCEKQSYKLKRFLGDELYEELLFDTERA